jgi:hypothetical protein
VSIEKAELEILLKLILVTFIIKALLKRELVSSPMRFKSTYISSREFSLLQEFHIFRQGSKPPEEGNAFWAVLEENR